MKALDCLAETVKRHEGIGEATKSANSDKDLYDVLTFGGTKTSKAKGHELPYSDGKKRAFSFDE